MSPEEREIVDAASPRVQAILLGTHESGPSLAPPAKPARATRSDKGTKKGPKVTADTSLGDNLRHVVNRLIAAERVLEGDQRRVNDLREELEGLLDSLTK